MAKKMTAWKTKGMNQDISVSAFNPEFSFSNLNLRLSTNDGNTTMSWVNEKSTSAVSIYREDQTGSPTETLMSLIGSPLGTAVINDYLILFTKGVTPETSGGTDVYDYIYRLKYSGTSQNSLQCRILCKSCSSYMNLSLDHPLETLVSYENEHVQKVYWTDNFNQPRIINICKEYISRDSEDDSIINPINNNAGGCAFDFVQQLHFTETVTVQKVIGGGGMFPAGVIQYCFTYYNKHMQETNIFYTTPLYYISPEHRGAKPDDRVENVFNIKITGVDSTFEYVRIYSIHRSRLDGDPYCRLVQDIEIASLEKEEVNSVEVLVLKFTDTGRNGRTIAPSDLLYKGGNDVHVETMTQKDNTLFFGNITTVVDTQWLALRESFKELCEDASKKPSFSTGSRTLYVPQLDGDYSYGNQLTAFRDSAMTVSVPCGGFKSGDYYRCGIQLQSKTGVWSEPLWIGDYKVGGDYGSHPSITSVGVVTLNTINCTLLPDSVELLVNSGYKALRPVVVFPKIQDRVCMCQGVVNPTMYTNNRRLKPNEESSTVADKYRTGDLQAQSSWFFRPYMQSELNLRVIGANGSVAPQDKDCLVYCERGIAANIPVAGDSAWNPELIRRVEIQGCFDDDNKFQVDRTDYLTLHSPDIEFDETMQLLEFIDIKGKFVGEVTFTKTFSDIDIQTETPTISNLGAGFIHKSFIEERTLGIVAGLFYDDALIDDWKEEFGADETIISVFKWFVFPWHKNGSLNNDFSRPADRGVQSALLRKKVISNLRYADTSFFTFSSGSLARYISIPKASLFVSNEFDIVRLGDAIYKGNIDDLLVPDKMDGVYMALNATTLEAAKVSHIETPFTLDDTSKYYKTFSRDETTPEKQGIYKYTPAESPALPYWDRKYSKSGDYYVDLLLKKEGVRMKYKGSPHLVFKVAANQFNPFVKYGDIHYLTSYSLPIVEIVRDFSTAEEETLFTNTIFGGNNPSALRENIWVPCGEPVNIPSTYTHSSITCYFEYGDTYFQRWDCLKTYPVSRDDQNQIVEIGSFLLESRMNIDGRYDRNRGQVSNINMSPVNFNLFNPVYSQTDNFFSYNIMDSTHYKDVKYPNMITWSLNKESGADVDLWTKVNLSSTLELDGDKGEIKSLQRYNNQLLCFQDSGISQILYNENSQISTAEGVPIEIANSGKVQGKRYLSTDFGCSNKWSIVNTPAGVFFMDSINKNIMVFGGEFKVISQEGGFNSWCKKNIPSSNALWTPSNFHSNYVGYYDKLNQEILYINNNIALAYSAKIGTFTSFYSYGDTPFLCNLNDTNLWIRKDCSIWKHHGGNNYCNFFNTNYPYSMVLVGNPEPQTNKIFTNLEMRASISGEGSVSSGKYTPVLPFNYLEVWNEYQHGKTLLDTSTLKHHEGNTSGLLRKFRIWRCDIPRDNYPLDSITGTDINTDKGIARYYRKPNDRMNNLWLYIELVKNALASGERMPKVEIHDIAMSYFG